MSYKDQVCFDLNDGNKMPALGYGTWQAEDADLEKALNKALEVGYRHIDTAAVYFNEHIIGKVLQEWFSSGKLKREDIYITTKLPFNAYRAHSVEKYLKKSLEDLKLDYLDMYLIHAPFGFVEGDELFPKDEEGKMKLDFDIDHVALWKGMEAQVDAGLTRSIGISNFNQKQIQRLLDNSRIPPANLQIELHINFQQKPTVEYCKKNNIVVTSYSSLGSPGTVKRFGKTVPSILENPVVLKIGEKYKKSPAQIALQFLIQQGIVVIPKSVNEKRVEENFKVLDFKIDDEDVETLKGLDQGEEGRLLHFHEHFKGVEAHPEYPFPV